MRIWSYCLRCIPLILLALPITGAVRLSAAERPRLAVLTDIGGDPDDQQSMIRLLVYANEFELELIIASASGTRGELKESVTRPDLIRQLISAYGRVLPNLQRHGTGWPSEDQLLQRVKSGNPQRGRDQIGDGHDTQGSQALIERIDSGTPERPLNISIWGGQTDLAQALWRVKHDRGPEQVQLLCSVCASMISMIRTISLTGSAVSFQTCITFWPTNCLAVTSARELIEECISLATNR